MNVIRFSVAAIGIAILTACGGGGERGSLTPSDPQSATSGAALRTEKPTLIVTSDCVVRGSGTLPTGDGFSGNIYDDEGLPAGSWTHFVAGTYVEHRDLDPAERGYYGEKQCESLGGYYARGDGAGHDSDGASHGTGHCEPDRAHTLVGMPDSLFCFINGGKIGVISGPATWDGESGYRFDLTVEADTVRAYDLRVIRAHSTVVYHVSGVPDSGDLEVLVP